ncbi:hypothetical protein LIER_02344 [Lithospermum erythrorhizon]|uniref:Uncharacterized protein n=1 Tax=Lithospermum erythrorhizon TaxID=34254 RepID=A0AAV3NP38_LITER
MLVDTDSSLDILYMSTYDKLQLSRSLLQPFHTPLTGFTGHSVFTTGVVTLDFTVSCGSKSSTIRAQFTVVDIKDPSYNGLIGRPILTALRAIVSPIHLKMKFPTPGGIEGEEEEDNEPKERESEKKGEPNAELESVPFQREVEKTFRIGTNLESKHRRGLIALVREYEDVFA